MNALEFGVRRNPLAIRTVSQVSTVSHEGQVASRRPGGIAQVDEFLEPTATAYRRG
jgi:hypothetical protein